MNSVKPMTIFWLVKTMPEWLAIKPKGKDGRFDFVEQTIKPILGKYPGARLSFYDAEAFTAVCSDVMQWTVTDINQYSAMVEDLRETAFWDRYFQVLHIIPTVKDGYAEHYNEVSVGDQPSKAKS